MFDELMLKIRKPKLPKSTAPWPRSCPSCWSNRLRLESGWWIEQNGIYRGKARQVCLACGKTFSWRRK